MVDTSTLARAYLHRLEARDWDTWSEMLHADVVYTTPHSRERWHGRHAFLSFNRSYPGEGHLQEKWILGDAGRAVLWFTWTVGDGRGDAQAFLTFDEAGMITEVTEFWPEPYEAPARPAPATVRY
ncbi:nuclear transport factor 2 family protein [Nesterenkonia suensis]